MQDIVNRAFGSEEIQETAKGKTFQSFTLSGRPPIVRQAKSCAMHYAEHFTELVSTQCNSMAFLGRSGSGKTHLMWATAHELMQNDIVCAYWPHLQKMNELRTQVRDNPEEFQRSIINVKRTPVLLWDDLFKSRKGDDKPPTSWVVDTIMEIVDYRYLNRMPMIISSEKSIKELMDIDEALGSRIYQMTKDHLIEFQGDGLNFRLAEV
jgi:DNA replication protein DnaC